MTLTKLDHPVSAGDKALKKKPRFTHCLVTTLLAGFLILRPFLTTPHSHFLSGRSVTSQSSNIVEGCFHCLHSHHSHNLVKMEKSFDDKWVFFQNASELVYANAIAFSLTHLPTESFTSSVYPTLRI